MALEYAQFKDYRIRDGLSEIIKHIDFDLDEVGFDASPVTRKRIDELESLITDIETEHAPKPSPIPFNEEEIPVREIHHEDEEIEASVRRIHKVDDELDEFEKEIASRPVSTKPKPKT
jgi:hypothetical protein